MKKEFRIPTILGLVFLSITALFGGALTSHYTTNIRTQASASCLPNSIKTSNITANSADVSFATDKDCDISLQVNNNAFLNTSTNSKIHYFKINGLTGGQTYPISLIISGQTQATQSQITTTNSVIASGEGASFAWGKVLNQDQSPSPNTLIYITLPNSQLLSALTTTQGSWNIPNALVNSPSPSQSTESIQVVTSTGQDLNLDNTTDNNLPVPDIILGQDNFTLPKYSSVNGLNLQQSNLSSGQTGSASSSLLISYPSQGEVLPPTIPEFFGSGPSSSTLSISLSGPISSTSSTQISSTGSWRWAPSQSLIIGSYVLKVQQGSNTLSRNFTVNTTNSGLAFISTPSATSAPTLVPTIFIPTPEPTLAPTATPTNIISTPTPRPTKLPTTGFVGPTGVLILVGLLLAGTSIFLQH